MLVVSLENRTLAQPAPLPGTYRSEVDDLLTVEKVSVLPFTDNLQGIYARPLESHFTQAIEKMHRWNFAPATNSGAILSPEELEASKEKVQQVSQGLGVDAIFASRITKGPNGVTIHLSLFLTKDGKLLSQAILKDHKIFNINDLKTQMDKLLSELVARLPYSGRVLSRDANRVTVNLGAKDGLRPQQMVSVIQIVQAQRHPKFNFLIKTEKEIFGKIKILKVDETLSFGVVVTEKEKGAIQKNAKVGPLEFVSYGGVQSLNAEASPEEALTQRDDSGIAFGKDAKPWLPEKSPSIGMVGARLGVTRYNGNVTLTSGALESSDPFIPNIFLDGELWITPQWSFRAGLRNAIWNDGNPLSSGQPSNLNHVLTYYEAGFGYTVRFGSYIWSPFLEPYLSYFAYKLTVDKSTPDALTTMEYTGFKLGLRGSTPVGDSQQFGIGGDFSIAPRPSLNETPEISGGAEDHQAVQFGLFGYKRIGERLKLQIDLDYEIYSTDFNGTGTRSPAATSSSQRHTTVSGGVYYLF